MNLMVEMSSRDIQEVGWTGLGCGLEMGGRGKMMREARHKQWLDFWFQLLGEW